MEACKVLVVGAGMMGAFFDAPGSTAILSHAHAITNSPYFRLVGFVDVSGDQASRAANTWGGDSFTSIEAAIHSTNPEIAVVAVPDDHHHATLLDLARFPLKAVIAEKPITKTLTEAERIKKLYQENSISVLVNYSRQFIPEYQDLKQAIREERFGSFLAGTVMYGKGILHNGSHALNLLHGFLGPVKNMQVVSSNHDVYPDDPSISAVLHFENGGIVTMHHINPRHYTVFELDLFFERHRIRIVDSGVQIEYHHVIENPAYKGYFKLEPGESRAVDLGSALEHLYLNLHEHLTSGAPLLCTIDDGITALATCERLQQLAGL